MAPRTGHHHRNSTHELTKRQREVLALVADGKTNVEVADSLGIGFESAKTHVSEILARLGVESREEAAAAWRADQGLLTRLRRTATGFFLTGFGKAAAGAVAVLVVVAGVSAAVYVGGDSGDGSLAADDEPTEVVPAPTARLLEWSEIYQDGDIHDARLDLAARLNIDPLDVRVSRMVLANWGGCLGLAPPPRSGGIAVGCTSIGLIGSIVYFESAGQTYRYHVAGTVFVAVHALQDPVIDDDRSFPFPEMERDLRAVLQLARGDIELRTGTPRDEWLAQSIIPTTFTDGCLGFRRSASDACSPGEVHGAIVDFARGAETHRYHVSLAGIIGVDLEAGTATVEPDPAMITLFAEMRLDAAERLHVDIETVQVTDVLEVVWPDSCLAVPLLNENCERIEVDGFHITLASRENTVAAYHASTTRFVAVAPLAVPIEIGEWVRLRN